MLKQASVSDLLQDRVSRSRKNYVVITMRRYPRFVNRAFRDEYVAEMSPDWKLFEAWLTAKRKYQDHDGAFTRSRFEERFTISHEGLEHLGRLCALAVTKDVYFVCQCKVGEKCHREMVLMLAKKWFKVKVEKPTHAYPVFESRLNRAQSILDLVRTDTHRKKARAS